MGWTPGLGAISFEIDTRQSNPATGTGTFLFRIIDRIAETVAELEGEPAVPARLVSAAPRLIGFELQMGPYSVAQLRLTEEFRRRGANVGAEDLRLYVANTLDDPYIENRLGGIYEPIARSRREANQVKSDEDVLVVIGNPPYKAGSGGEGGWIESGSPERKEPAPLDEWKAPASWGIGPDLKHLSNPYVYFWRWATWKIFDHPPAASRKGIVSFITVAGFLNGRGFQKMRDYLRRTCSEIWVIGLTPEGHQPPVPSRVFAGVQQPVCIVTALRSPDTSDGEPATVRYYEVAPGNQAEKFQELEGLDFDSGNWIKGSSDWRASFLPPGSAKWQTYPSLKSLMPWDGSGVMAGRTWVIGPDPETLKLRFDTLVVEPSDDKKRILLKEHPSDRRIETVVSDNLYGFAATAVPIGLETEAAPDPVRIAYRTLDRQWILPDKRLINRPNPAFWFAHGPRQIYLTCLQQHAPSDGPGVTFAADIPDLHHYKGSFGGRATPLWRDRDCSQPNIAPGLLDKLEEVLGWPIDPEDFLAYIAAVAANPEYLNRFSDDLTTPGVRIPLTAEPSTFKRAVQLGRRVIWLHTYGERLTDPSEGRPRSVPRVEGDRRPKVVGEISSGPADHPIDLTYDTDLSLILIGTGAVGPVEQAVWDYSVSGTNLISKWFSYRSARPEGKHSSPLDELVPTGWPAQYTSDLLALVNALTLLVDLEEDQGDLLAEVVSGPLVTVEDLDASQVLPADERLAKPPRLPRSRPTQPGLSNDMQSL